MYVPNQYEAPDVEARLHVIRAAPLGTLISWAAGSPFVSHIPFTIYETEPTIILTGHMARANPHWKYFDEAPALVIFRGPEGYISPRFYQDCTTNVPSWNYVVVHCTGTADVAPPERTQEILAALVDQMEDVPSSIEGVLAYPLVLRGDVLGVLVLGRRRSGEAYAPDESEAISYLAHNVATALGAHTTSHAAADNTVAESLRAMRDSIESLRDAIQADRLNVEPQSQNA